MTEYIKREDVIERLTNLMQLQAPTARAIVEAVPSADVVERKKGKWEKHHDDVVYWWQCSECQCVAFFEDALTPYCPHCGAEMERSEE